MDGSARGGSVIAVERELQIPIKFIGTGEGISDLQPFDPKLFVDQLF
jgi:fused signal recognition particle receptor